MLYKYVLAIPELLRTFFGNVLPETGGLSPIDRRHGSARAPWRREMQDGIGFEAEGAETQLIRGRRNRDEKKLDSNGADAVEARG